MTPQASNGGAVCELFFVAFAKTPLDSRRWQLMMNDIVTSTAIALSPKGFARGMQSRVLDFGSSRSEIRVMEMSVVGRRKPATLAECTTFCMKNSQMQEIQQGYGVEIIVQPGELHRLHQSPGLAVFDMDSTLIQQEVIDELARAVGLYDKVAAITEAAMRGEAPYTDFEASLRARVALLKGVPTSIWEQLKREVITFTPGAKELIRVLQQLGWKTAVLSGGFTPLANWVKDTHGLDYAFANHLASDPEQGILTGELVLGAPIVHGERKRVLLEQLAFENGIPEERTIAVGDGSNDLKMMGAAGLGIAFNAKPKVQLAAPARLNSLSLVDVLHILGFSRDDIDIILAVAPKP